MSELDVLESPREQASGEVVAWVFDFTNRLISSQTVSSATATMTQLDTGTDVSVTTIVGSPSVSSPNVTVTVQSLTARKRYRLSVLAVLSGGSHQVADLELEAPH